MSPPYPRRRRDVTARRDLALYIELRAMPLDPHREALIVLWNRPHSRMPGAVRACLTAFRRKRLTSTRLERAYTALMRAGEALRDSERVRATFWGSERTIMPMSPWRAIRTTLA